MMHRNKRDKKEKAQVENFSLIMDNQGNFKEV
jgi:hypothetical protein